MIPEEITSLSLAATTSKNKWITARAHLIREYAIRETSVAAAEGIERLLDELGDSAIPALREWVKITRESGPDPSLGTHRFAMGYSDRDTRKEKES